MVPKKLIANDHPHHRDGDVDGPDQLGVLLGLGEAQREGDRGGDDDRLPAPEVEAGESASLHMRTLSRRCME